MHKIIAIGEVEDLLKWEQGFQTHGALFKRQTVASPIHFATEGDGNQVAVLFEASDLDEYLKGLDSPDTAEAMAYDGVKRDTVKFFVLDKTFRF